MIIHPNKLAMISKKHPNSSTTKELGKTKEKFWQSFWLPLTRSFSTFKRVTDMRRAISWKIMRKTNMKIKLECFRKEWRAFKTKRNLEIRRKLEEAQESQDQEHQIQSLARKTPIKQDAVVVVIVLWCDYLNSFYFQSQSMKISCFLF